MDLATVLKLFVRWNTQRPTARPKYSGTHIPCDGGNKVNMIFTDLAVIEITQANAEGNLSRSFGGRYTIITNPDFWSHLT
jgi:hypothetical protein